MPLASDLAGYLQRGDTLPATGFDGRLWLHTPTGRAWQRLYHGTTWYGQFGFGAVTLYVDGTAGTDAPGQGTGTGAAAFRTIQYAVDQLPALLFGNVTITLAAGTYREMVTLEGKWFTGAFTLKLEGATTDLVAATTVTSAANPAGNGVAGFGTLTKTGAAWTVNAFQHKWVEITAGPGAGQTRLLYANTATVLTIVGRWDTVPTAASSFRVFDLAARITGSDAAADTTPVRLTPVAVRQRNVEVSRLRLTHGLGAGLTVYAGAYVTVRACEATGNASEGFYFGTGAAGAVWNSRAAGQNYNVRATTAIVDPVWGCTLSGASGTYGLSATFQSAVNWGQNVVSGGATILAEHASVVFVYDYTEVDGGGTHNWLAQYGGIIGGQTGAPVTIVSRNSAGFGFGAAAGGIGLLVTLWTYAGNASGSYSPTTAPPAGVT